MNENQRAWEPYFRFRPPLLAENSSPKLRSMLIAGYDGSLAYLDDQIGRLLGELRRRGVLDDTLLIVTSDHGEAFGAHGYFAHGHSLYRNQIQIPLILRLPGKIPAGLRVSPPVSLRDVPATVMELLAPQRRRKFPGRPLTFAWTDDGVAAESGDGLVLSEVVYREGFPKEWPISAGWIRSLITPRWHFIEYQRGDRELYEISGAGSATESENLAETPRGKRIIATLSETLRWARSHPDQSAGERAMIGPADATPDADGGRG
jgi:hypothetical protein